MICPICGRNIQNEEAHFCEYCGASLRGGETVYQGKEELTPQGNAETPQTNLEPISFGNWFGSMALLFIPVVGTVVFLVMLCIWAFDSSTNPNKKSWARATLVMGLILLAIFILIFTYTMRMVVSMPEYQDLLNQLTAY